MTTFRAFLRILQKNSVTIVISTIVLLIFGGFSMQASENGMGFVADKPDVTVVNYDDEGKIARGFEEYLGEKCNIIELSDDEAKIKDALFYRNTNLVIYIPQDYSEDLMRGENPAIEYRSSGDYQAELGKMIATRYLETVEAYRDVARSEGELVEKAKTTLAEGVEIEVVSKLDTTSLERTAKFFNFESYALLNSLVFIIAVVMLAFNNKRVRQRILVSSTNPAKQSRILFFANLGFAAVIWLMYLGLGFIILGGESLLDWHGAWFVVNSLIFTVCATSIAFLVGSLLRNKDAINGVTNVIALGSSFLCGAFVPQMWLPDSVLWVAHLLPTYYFIDNNDTIAGLETLDGAVLGLVLNMVVMLGFAVLCTVIAVVVGRKRG